MAGTSHLITKLKDNDFDYNFRGTLYPNSKKNNTNRNRDGGGGGGGNSNNNGRIVQIKGTTTTSTATKSNDIIDHINIYVQYIFISIIYIYYDVDQCLYIHTCNYKFYTYMSIYIL